MSMAFFGWINPYRNEDSIIAGNEQNSSGVDEGTQPERGSLLSDMLSFQRHRNQRVLRPLAVLTLLTTAWLLFPRTVFAKPRVYKAYSQLTDKGLTQTPNAELRTRIEAREHTEQAKKAKRHLDVEPLSRGEMKSIFGRGANRNKYFTGTMPWQRSLRDVNLCNGNLFKSFTDVQVAPGRGAGLVLQRTYNSNDDQAGAFGIGWTHAYDIRMEEAGAVVENNVEKELVPRKDFFGGKHKYTRDADGLYTPPAYMYDEMDSRYDDEMVDGLPRSLEDIQVGMDGTIKHFIPEGTDALGRPSTSRVCDYIEDRYGNRTTLTYGTPITFPDGSTKKLLYQVKDPVNRTLTFTWLNLGTSQAPAYRITTVQSPTYTVTYDYYTNAGDTSSYLNLWKVHLDSTGLDRVMTYTYTTVAGEAGLLASIADPLGQTVTYTYAVPTANPTGTVWAKTVTEPAGVDINNTPRQQTWYIFPAGWYDGMLQVQFANYNPTSKPIRQSVAYYIDPQLRVKALVMPVNSITPFRYEYDLNNNVTLQVSAGGDELYTGGQTVLTGNAYENRVHSSYGPHGNVLSQWSEGFSDTVTYTYYNASKYFQKESVTDALGRTSSFDYFDKSDPTPGNRGNVKWVRDAGYGVSTSPSYNKEFSYTYNQYGQKASETNLNNVVTNYTYGDAWGNLTQVVQDPGTGKLNRTTSMAYDTVGKVTSSTDPNGQTSTFAYNTLGQPTSASFPAKTGIAAAETISYTYGTNGRTASVTDNRGTTSMTYENGSDRVSSVTDPVTGTVGYKYNLEGMRTDLNLPGGGTVTYQYENPSIYIATFPKDDPNSWSYRLLRITDDGGRRVDFGYTGTVSANNHEYGSDASGRPASVAFNQTFDSYGNLLKYVETRWRLDGTTGSPALVRGLVGRMTTTFYERANSNAAWTSKLLYQNEYAYNNNGQRTANTITTTNSSNVQVSRTENYTYDELSRLKTANYGDGQSQTYAFDAMGNRTAKTDNVTGNETYDFDNANRMLHRYALDLNYTNDANGNQVADGDGDTNDWDSQNRLVHSWNSGPDNEATYAYGADGLRRKSSIIMGDDYNGNPNPMPRITHYGYDGTNVVREWDENVAGVLSVSATYLLGPNGPMYKRPANAADVRWYVYDGLGSVVGEVDVNGTLIAEKKHDVYGLRRGTVGTEKSKHGFVGGLGHYSDDETGLIYMRARYYDPAIGRFISEDPARDGTNWFAYCNNDPVNKIDQDGRVAVGSMEWWSGVFYIISVTGGGKYTAFQLRTIADTMGKEGTELIQRGEANIMLAEYLEKISNGDPTMRSNAAAGMKAGGEMVGRGIAYTLIALQLRTMATMFEGGGFAA